MTVVRNKANTLPLKPTANSKILMLTPYENQPAQLLLGLNRARAAKLVPKETRAWAGTFSANNGAITGELKKASVKSLKAGKRKLKVTMTTKPKSKGGTKYQVAYKIKSKKKWKYKTTSKKTLTIKKLKAKKRYKVRVRVCKKVNGKMQYGAWSKTKTSKKIK